MSKISKSNASVIKPGMFMSWNGKTFRIVSFDNVDGRIINVENVDDHTEETISIEDLLFGVNSVPVLANSLPNLKAEINKESPYQGPVPEANLPKYLLEKADLIIGTVEKVESEVENATSKSMGITGQAQRHMALKRVLDREGIPSSTYYKYLDIYQKFNGDKAKIASRFRKNSFQKILKDKTTLCLIDILIARYFARQNMLLAPSHIYKNILTPLLNKTGNHWIDPDKCSNGVPKDLIEDLFNKKVSFEEITSNPERLKNLSKIKKPSRAWFYYYLRWFTHQKKEGTDAFLKRYGKEAFENEYMIFDTFLNNASRPLEMVFADHYLLDANIVDDETRSKISRLWLTILIDAFSRSIIGFALLYEGPCTESIQTALKNAVWPKNQLLEELGITDKPWPCYGIPQKLSLDNAWAHHSYSLETLAKNISCQGRYNSIQLEFRPPYRGRYGALVERLFKNFSSKIKALLPGAIQSGSPQDTRNARHNACLLYSDMVKIIIRMIVEYQHSEHSELNGMTPHEKWMDGIKTGLPLVPPYNQANDRLFLRLSTETRSITTRGIAMFGMHYWSPEVSALPRIEKNGEKAVYGIAYDPNDISQISLFHDGHWVGDVKAKELRLQDGSTMSISLAEKEMASVIAKSQGRAAENWLNFISDIEEVSDQRSKEKETIKKAQSKLSLQKKKGKKHINIQTMETEIVKVSENQVDDELTRLLMNFKSQR